MRPPHPPLQEKEGPELSADRVELLAAVFRQRSLLDSYLAPYTESSKLQDDRNHTITELVRFVLGREEASQDTGAGLESHAWASVTASVQPYIWR